MLKYGLALLGLISLVTAQSVQLPDSIAEAGVSITWIKKIPQYCEGPVWEPSTGSVYFTEQRSTGTLWPIWKIPPADTAGSIFVNTQQSNGLEFDPQGRLVACQNGRIARYKSDGTLDSILAQSGSPTFGQANDLSIGANGAMYFTDLSSRVFFLSANRVLSTATTNISSANGVEWMEAENAVYVNSTSGNSVYRFAIGTNGALSSRTTFASSPGPDGGTYDSHGNRYVASYSQGEIRVFNARGDSIGRIVMAAPPGAYNARSGIAGNADNCVFGDADLKTLYITGDGGLYSIRLKIPGVSRFTTPIARYTLRPINRANPDVFRDVRGRWVGYAAARKTVLMALPVETGQ